MPRATTIPMKLIWLSLLVCCGYGCSAPANSPDPAAEETVSVDTTGELTNFPLENLLAVRRRALAGEPVYRRAMNHQLERADALLDGPDYTIVNKEVLPPSGDAHDYLSLGPYWWPDPDRADGLPWIRRDGEVNPVTTGEQTDKTQKNRLLDAVEELAYAGFLTGDPQYGRRADTLLRVFFLDPATRMNPHLEYAQGIPGRNDGRCFGIIELAGVIGLVTSLELLERSGGLGERTRTGVKEWLGDYLNWLQTSELGLEEKSRLNNHATWYDAQVIAILRYLGRDAEARTVAESVRARIDRQLAPDGSQPHELERTKSLSYSTMNLRGLTQLAYYGRRLGVDLWEYESPDGGSLPKAYAFLRPYVSGEREWTRQQLGDLKKSLAATRGQFVRAGSLLAIPELCATEVELPAKATVGELLYRCYP